MKLSNIEKILLAATFLIALVGLFGKITSHSDNRILQRKPVQQIENDLGLTVSEFQKAYEELVVRYSVPLLRIRGTYTYNDNGKYKTYFHTSDTVVLELETDISKTRVQSINVFCEPKKSVNIRSVAERAAIAYALVVEILTPELTTYERGKILKSLSSNFKKSTMASQC